MELDNDIFGNNIIRIIFLSNHLVAFPNTYEYNGKQYTQSEIGLNAEKEYDSRFQEALYEKLKAMQTVVIYVNPENPNEATILKYDINLKDIGAGIALILFPLLILHWAYIRRKYALDFLARNITTLS